MISFLLFWLPVVLLGYTYLLYPLLLELFAWRLPAKAPPSPPTTLPRIAILMAAFNEEKVLPAKLASVRNLDYPSDRLTFWVGSDGSTDATDSLLAEAAAAGLPLQWMRLEGRLGKASVLNALREAVAKAENQPDLLLLTDANILYDPALLQRMVRHFNDPAIGLVGAVVKHPGKARADGIARQEGAYISRENRIKYLEGTLWGAMMGAFGACYMVRRQDFPALPAHFLMEDFYASMHVLASGRKAILDPEATCTEDLPDAMGQEFRRKVRISAGNFQNLRHWLGLLWPPSALSFTFLSHKILRWLGPLWLIWALVGAVILTFSQPGYVYALVLQGIFWSIPLLDRVLQRLGIHIGPVRLIGYFCSMNVALLAGFLRYLRGIRSTAWQPPTRQSHHG